MFLANTYLQDIPDFDEYDHKSHAAYMREVLHQIGRDDVLTIADLIPADKKEAILTDERMMAVTEQFCVENKGKHPGLSTKKLRDFIKKNSLRSSTLSKPEESELYRWVEDFIDANGGKVNAAGDFTMPEGDERVLPGLLILDNHNRGENAFRLTDSNLGKIIDLFKHRRKKAAFDLFCANLSIKRAAKSLAELETELVKMFTAAIPEGTSHAKPNVAASLILKLIWQVKRKMHGLPVTDHMMPVFVGGQGCGKTELMMDCTAPMAEMRRDLSLSQITDDRHIDIFSNLVGTVDEMSKFEKADIETLKTTLTADTMTRRVMGTNGGLKVKQMLSLIGTCNKDVSEVVRDETGNRRFPQIDIAGQDYWQMSKDFDWIDLWRAVDENGPDPCLPVMAQIKATQAATRDYSLEVRWLLEEEAELRRKWGSDPEEPMRKRGVVRTEAMHEVFSNWASNAGYRYTTNRHAFEKVLARALTQGEVIFVGRARTDSERGYVFDK